MWVLGGAGPAAVLDTSEFVQVPVFNNYISLWIDDYLIFIMYADKDVFHRKNNDLTSNKTIPSHRMILFS